jgi:TldD protein
MRRLLKKTLKILGIGIFIFSIAFQGGLNYAQASKAPKASNVVLKAMEDELARNMKILKEKGTPPPYFIGYRITDTNKVTIRANSGSLEGSAKNRSRLLDVDVRVGSYKLDNSHQIKGNLFDIFRMLGAPVNISIEDDPDTLKNAIWLETDKKYKDAVERLIQVEANKGITVKEEDQSDDFSQDLPQKYIDKTVSIAPDTAAWEAKLKGYSALFNDSPEIHNSSVSLIAEAENKYMVNSEGASLLFGRTHWRLSISADTKADDGMELSQFKTFDALGMENFPDDKTVKEAIRQVINDVLALRKAPAMEPFTGPAILSGKASAVFFHEIFGHRIEGHRQKDESEGQTFAKMVNQQILPTFLSVYDDPTMTQYEKTDLNGFYLYDDQGVKSQRATLVDKGILKGFLMSRSPIKDFPKSNGHGRAEAGLDPVSRQGVLVMESAQTVPWEKLKEQLIEECKKQGKPYGLIFDDISGGFTNTRRMSVQAFSVLPIMVYRVYLDGREELVRGVDMIGTPLTTFSKIIACGDKPAIFNGYCGAESGSVPASCISLPILTAQIEVQKKFKDSDKPPALPPPDRRLK